MLEFSLPICNKDKCHLEAEILKDGISPLQLSAPLSTKNSVSSPGANSSISKSLNMRNATLRYVVVKICLWVKSDLPLFWGMLMSLKQRQDPDNEK